MESSPSEIPSKKQVSSEQFVHNGSSETNNNNNKKFDYVIDSSHKVNNGNDHIDNNDNEEFDFGSSDFDDDDDDGDCDTDSLNNSEPINGQYQENGERLNGDCEIDQQSNSDACKIPSAIQYNSIDVDNVSNSKLISSTPNKHTNNEIYCTDNNNKNADQIPIGDDNSISNDSLANDNDNLEDGEEVEDVAEEAIFHFLGQANEIVCYPNADQFRHVFFFNRLPNQYRLFIGCLSSCVVVFFLNIGDWVFNFCDYFLVHFE